MLVTSSFFFFFLQEEREGILREFMPDHAGLAQWGQHKGFLCVLECAGEGTSESFVSRHIQGPRQFCTCLSSAKASKRNQHGSLPPTH